MKSIAEHLELEFDRMFNPVPNMAEMMKAFELTVRACGWTFDEMMLVWGAYFACYLLEKDFNYEFTDKENYAKADK